MTTASNSNKAYDASSIQHLSGAEAIRKKAGMYIGATDGTGIFTILREVLDNVRDENLAGRGTTCEIYVGDDGSFTVVDDGGGMPVGLMSVTDAVSGKKYKMPAIQAITGLVHAGGKMDADSSAYATSVGSHGVGQKATNFLSDSFEVTTFNQGSWWSIGYRKGKLKLALAKCSAPDHPFRNRKLKRGTLITFKPDYTIFSERKFPLSMIHEWATNAAYFTHKMRITFAHFSGKEREYYAPEGPKSYVEDRLVKLKATPLDGSKPLHYTDKLVDCVFQYTNVDGCELQSFTNGLSNPERGIHFNAFFSALHTALAPYAAKRQEFSAVELREGIVGLVNVKLSAPKFASQTKEKLTDPRGGKPVEVLLLDAFNKFFAANRAMAARICARAHELRTLKNQFTASKNVINAIKKVRSSGFPAKAAMSPNCKAEDRELILIEGESAAGTARQARNPHFQELLPLKGKPANVFKTDREKALTNEEVLNALAMIGFDPGKADPFANLRVGKIILLADPDPDGPLVVDTKLNVIDPATNTWVTRQLGDLDINLSHTVIAWKGTHFGTAQALVSFDGEEQTVKLKFGGFTETCTLTHKWPVVTRLGTVEWVEAQNLKPGLEILTHPKAGVIATRNLCGYQGYGTAKLMSVKRKGVKQVRCLTVPTAGNFLLESGVVTSNCHINSLLLALFFKFFPRLFELGIVYVAAAPEFYEVVGKELIRGSTPQEVLTQLTKLKAKGRANHIKGWGEVPPEVLELLAFNPSTRKLIKIEPVTADHGRSFEDLMGTGVAARKALLGIE